MAKPYRLGAPSTPSDRCADPNYVRVASNGPVPKVNVVPGLEQNRAPTMDVPIPLAPMQRVDPPWRFR